MSPLNDLWRLAGASIGAVGEALQNLPLVGDTSQRLAITGLQRAGKTVFVTSLAHALLHAREAPAEAFPFFPWRGQLESVTLETIPGIAAFPYAERLQELLADPPRWPERTTGLSGLRVRIRHRPQSPLTRQFMPVATLDLDLIDYPGEWLLDLPLLSLSFRDWSLQAEELALSGRRAALSAAWRAQRESFDPDAPEEPFAVARLAGAYADYLKRCQAQGLCYTQPARFIAGTAPLDALFFPLSRAGSARSGSNAAILQRRYEAYQQLVRRFYRDVFGRLRRQIVLVDLLTALQQGHESFADLALAVRAIADAFEAQKNPLLRLLALDRVDRLALVATKADHITAGQINNLVGLLRDMIGEPAVMSSARQSGLLAIAAVRATAQVVRRWQDQPLEFLRGVPLGRSEPVEVRPGEIPSQVPDSGSWSSFQFNIREFAPPRLGAPWNRPLPHINLDKVLQFLIA